MGRQINFFMMPDDIRELDAQIKKMGLKILEYKMPTQEIVQIDSLLDGKILKKIIVHPDYLNHIDVKFREKYNNYRIDFFNAPVIEFNRPYFNIADKILKRGRLYYGTYDNPIKDEHFYKIAEKLFRWTRRNLINTKINSSLTTQRAYEWQQNDNGKLLND